jgi:voltage-gated potassium channel
MFYYCFSRVNEVFLSFLNDAFDKLEKKENDCDDTLKYHERIKLALKSYIELVLDYGIIFFVLTKDCFNQLLSCERAFNENVDNIFEAIYFSGVTMTTLGYGDLSPESVITKFFSLYAVANGMLLIIVCFTVYVSLSFYSSCTDYKIDKKKSVKREIIFLIINFTVFIFLCVIHF